MKQKYTIEIAGVTLNILSDADAKSVETITNQLNKRMTEILSRSNQCPTTEASLLCSMSLLAERNKMLENCNRMENQLFKLTADKDALEREKDALLKEIENLKKNGISLSEAKPVVEEVPAYEEEPVSEIFAPAVTLKEEQPTVEEPEEEPVEEKVVEPVENPIQALIQEPEEEERTEEERLIDDGILNPVKTEHKPSIFDDIDEEETTNDAKKSSGNKVGEMFDFLTFSDV